VPEREFIVTGTWLQSGSFWQTGRLCVGGGGGGTVPVVLLLPLDPRPLPPLDPPLLPLDPSEGTLATLPPQLMMTIDAKKKKAAPRMIDSRIALPSDGCGINASAIMRSPAGTALGALVLLTLACGAPTPNAVAEPRRAGPPTSDEPLIHENIPTAADGARALREYYTKYEYRIPMRDGVKLFTSAYVPKDRSHSYPILMSRTPYSVQPYGEDNYPGAARLSRSAPSNAFIKEGYIIVNQDVRGRLMSEGTFVDVRPHATQKGGVDESTDAYDTIDWLVKNVPANNGRVGIWGISYPGFYAAQSAVEAHPALKAVSPQAPVTEWFLGDDFHHNGAFFLADAFDFYSSFGKPRPKPTKKLKWETDHDGADVYDFFLAMGPLSNANSKYLENGIPFWNDLASHPNRDDWWKARDPRPWYRDAKPAVMTVGGWFDAEDLFGALETYRAFEKQSPRSENTLVMGPWRHGGWNRAEGDKLGEITFGQKTSIFYQNNIEFPFFQKHLKGAKTAQLPEAYVFETGSNIWERFASWPPPDAKPVKLYFRAQGALSLTPPNDDGADPYVSDPNKPVPYRAKMSSEIDAEYMTDDQRFASRRPDVVTYQTPDLDADVTIGGGLEATLFVSTTGTDADFVVKLVDVFPSDVADPDPNPTNVHMGGYQMLVRGEIMRGRYRGSYESPKPFAPGEVAQVKFTLPDTCHTFRSGHRIMVQVQSSWFPLADRNPQTFVDIYKATESDFKVATHKIHRAPDKASSLTLALRSGKIP
jgi:putative CocE/NonD family hydrolase